MQSNIKWEDLIYCSHGKLSLTSEKQLILDASYQSDPVLFLADLHKAALEAQMRNNALLPINEYGTTVSEVVTPDAYYDEATQTNLDTRQLSIQVATNKNGTIVKGI